MKEIHHGKKNYAPSPESSHPCQKGKYGICFLVQPAERKEVTRIALGLKTRICKRREIILLSMQISSAFAGGCFISL